jgi:hypothetical protein
VWERVRLSFGKAEMQAKERCLKKVVGWLWSTWAVGCRGNRVSVTGEKFRADTKPFVI